MAEHLAFNQMVVGSIPIEPVSATGGNLNKMKEFSLLNHDMVPNHEILSDEEIALVLEKYNIKKEQLPKIKTVDPVVKEIKASSGNVIKVTRKSATAGEATIYRLVI